MAETLSNFPSYNDLPAGQPDDADGLNLDNDEAQEVLGSELQALLNMVLYQLKRLLNFDSAAVYSLNGKLSPWMAASSQRFKDLVVPMQHESQAIIEAQLVYEALNRNGPLIIADINQFTGGDAVQHLGGNQSQLENMFLPVRSWLGVPLEHHNLKLGLLALRHNRPDYFTERHARLVLATIEQSMKAHSRLFYRAQALAVLEERQRIARDLHDSVTQVLYGIELGINTCLSLLELDPSRVAGQLHDLLNLAETGLTDMRALLVELRPEVLESNSLSSALMKLAVGLSARQIEVETQLSDVPNLPPALKEAVYRIAQEALNNILKHSQANHVEISLHHDRDFIYLEVRDNGRGFNPDGVYPGHLGLLSMRERATHHNCSLEIVSQIGAGSRISLKAPFHSLT